jgi:Domain of unknown function (DUF4126)
MQMDIVLSLCAGIGLSAACGFRVFVPLLILSVASATGHVSLSSEFSWLGSPIAVVALSVATALEITAYYVPWLDNALDTLATPAAAIAGTIATASMIGEMSPFLKWTTAVIAGGGAATLVQGGTVMLRAASTAATGGLANPLFATMELGGSVFAGISAVLAPVLAAGLMVAVAVAIVIAYKRSRASKASLPPQLPPAAPTLA